MRNHYIVPVNLVLCFSTAEACTAKHLKNMLGPVPAAKGPISPLESDEDIIKKIRRLKIIRRCFGGDPCYATVALNYFFPYTPIPHVLGMYTMLLSELYANYLLQYDGEKKRTIFAYDIFFVLLACLVGS